jgi:organic hydroperoxide reductase OsmC/OhrA
MSTDRRHDYALQTVWTGNRGVGTAHYSSYDRRHDITAIGKPAIPGSSDPVFRGERTRYSPEELLVASLSACHMLQYLHLCADAKIVVVEYTDEAAGEMIEQRDCGGRFTEVVLRPVVVIQEGDVSKATELHERAHQLCFIANSVNFAVHCEPEIRVAPPVNS